MFIDDQMLLSQEAYSAELAWPSYYYFVAAI